MKVGFGEIKEQRKEILKELNDDIKTSATFDAADAGIPFNLTDISDILKKDGELITYPVIYDFKHEPVGKVFKERFIIIKLWGCNWDCRWCRMKFSIFKDVVPIKISSDQITDLLLNFDADTASTALVIGGSGGEPLLQKEEMLKLIEILKTKTNYPVFLKTNGSLIEENFIDITNDLGLDGIVVYFHGLDDKWHKWYTGGYSNKGTINALKLITEKFKGQIVVTIVLYPEIDMVTFENTCQFLHGINPDFVIHIACPCLGSPNKHECKECHEKGRYEAEEIAMRYFTRIDRSIYFSKQTNEIRCLIEENERGRMVIIKSREWIKEGGRGGELLGDDKNERGGEDEGEIL